MLRKPMAARLQEKFTIDFQSGCWNWRGGSNGNGYGRMFDRHKLRPAHQIATN